MNSSSDIEFKIHVSREENANEGADEKTHLNAAAESKNVSHEEYDNNLRLKATELALLDKAKKKLCYAILNNDHKPILEYIQSAGEVNFLTLIYAAKEEQVVTPLSMAVQTLCYKTTKILLEAGADPNIKGLQQKSLIEMLMAGISELEVRKLNNKPFRKTIVLLGKKVPEKITPKLTLTAEKIADAEKILDLLLCYGLDPNFAWTNNFKEIAEKHRRGIDDVRHEAVKESAKPDIIKSIFQLQQAKPSIERSIVAGFTKCTLWIRNHVKSQPNYENLQDFLATIPRVPQIALDTTAEIQQEKQNLITRYQREMNQLQTRSISINLINIIIQYISTFSDTIAADRQKNNRTLTFWNTKKEYKAEDERAKKNRIQFSQIYLALKFILDDIGEEANDLVLEYLYDPEVVEATQAEKRLAPVF